MKFKLFNNIANLKLHDIEVLGEDGNLIHELNIDSRVDKTYNMRCKITNKLYPWIVRYFDIPIAIVDGKKCLLVSSHCQGDSGKSQFDCYYCSKQNIEDTVDFCDRFNMSFFVYGKSITGLTVGHFPMEIDSFLKKYIAMKLGDYEKNYLTWTVFHEILGDEPSLFKD